MTSTSIHSTQVSRASFSRGSGESNSSSTTTTTTSKLRDSCHACALSKVKCHKQKPTCSRCIKRGIACEYIKTKRPGRKRDSTHIDTSNDRNGDTIEVVRLTPSVTQNPWLSMTNSANESSTLSGSTSFLSPLSLNPSSPRSDNAPGIENSNSDIFDNLLMPLEHYPSELMGMNNEFDEFFNSPVNFSGSETSDYQFLAQGHNDIAKLLMPDETNPELSKISSTQLSNTLKAASPPNSWSLSNINSSLGSASESCICLIQALDIMKKLSSNSNTASSQLNSGGNATKMYNVDSSMNIEVPSAQNVVVENKQIIDVLTPMLQCSSCGEDGYLLMVLSMIVFRVLGRYAAAALQHPNEDGDRNERSIVRISTKEHKRRFSNFVPDSEDPRRMAAQLILRELHRVLQLINDLSLRLQAHGRGSRENNTEEISVVKILGWESQTTFSDHLTKAVPFSAARFAQLEVDMRKCLNTLSSEIIKMLQNI